MRIGTLVQLWRYPVKGMGGERRPAVTITRRGIPGDRGWALYDEDRGGITGAKRLPAIRNCRARYPSEPEAGAASPPAEIEFPDGATFSTGSPGIARRLCELAGRAVSLRALGPAGSETDPRITMASEPPETARALMGLAPGEPEADMSAFTPERLRQLRQGNFFDAYPLHLVTRTTLDTLARLAPESAWDVRRFRPNLLLDTGAGGDYPEMEWIGRRLRVGTAVLDLVMGCPRCVMVTQQAGDLPQDHRVMRTLVRETRHLAGLYASVAEAGQAAEGDAVELL